MALILIFGAALAIRWTYAGALFATMGEAGITGTDSLGYLDGAQAFAKAIAAGDLHDFGWLGAANYAMPLFQWMLGVAVLLFGHFGAMGYVLAQGILDAGTCVLIACLAGEIDPRYARSAGIAAAINPTQVVLSGLVYTDTPFLFFTAIAMLATVRWLKTRSTGAALIVGLSLGAATLIRALSAAFVPVLLAFMGTTAFCTKWRSRAAVSRQLALLALAATLCIAPVILRNVKDYGSWSLTPQGGMHLALWIAPLVQEAKDGTPWQQSYDRNQALVAQRFPAPTTNLFELSHRYTVIAREQLAGLGIAAIVKAWLVGAAINLGAPAVILSPPISHLPRTGFYGTPGVSMADKVTNFLFRSDNAIYAWFLLVGIVGVGVIRLVQLAGVIVMARERHWAPLILFGLWIGYILAINGPVASPKYRLPLEIPFCVLTGAGVTMRRRAYG